MSAPLEMMPIVYVTDMETSLHFYVGLGFVVQNKGGMWSELRLGEGVLALHYSETLPPQPSRIALAFVSHHPAGGSDRRSPRERHRHPLRDRNAAVRSLAFAHRPR
jgi:catechol 2,3-dioxygenase-like lactoylglutathione lyase family enzyme